MLKVAIIGFGGIAHSGHIKNHLALEEEGREKLVAVCDIRPECFEQEIQINTGGTEVSLRSDVGRYTDWKEMLDKEDVDVVDICVPTFLHREITVQVLKMGYHVLCEKPMAPTYEDCMEMCKTAEETGKKLMIGQCVRFGAGMQIIKKFIDEQTYGKVKSAVLRRLSAPPMWGWDNWYMDYKLSGGCIRDLHVHDIDYARYAFGDPKAVSCVTADKYSGKDVVHSRLMYDDFSIMVIGDWSREGFPFQSDCEVAFENATVMLQMGREMKICTKNGELFNYDFTPNVSYKAEMEYFYDLIENGTENTQNPPESSALTIKLVNTLVESSDKNGEFIAFSAK